MKLFDPPRITLIWLAIGTIFWIIIGIITLNAQGETWKVMLQFALAALCLVGVILGTLAKRRKARG
jgi:hypothetical protein